LWQTVLSGLPLFPAAAAGGEGVGGGDKKADKKGENKSKKGDENKKAKKGK